MYIDVTSQQINISKYLSNGPNSFYFIDFGMDTVVTRVPVGLAEVNLWSFLFCN